MTRSDVSQFLRDGRTLLGVGALAISLLGTVGLELRNPTHDRFNAHVDQTQALLADQARRDSSQSVRIDSVVRALTDVRALVSVRCVEARFSRFEPHINALIEEALHCRERAIR